MSESPIWPQMALSVLVLMVGGHLISKYTENVTPDSLLKDVGIPDSLKYATISEGEKKIEKVTDGIYVARGYSLGNSILVEAPDGAVIIDTTENLLAARELFAAFRNITKAPVKAIVYTHQHADHVYGAKAFVEDNMPLPVIWAHESFMSERKDNSLVGMASFTRAMRQFGGFIPQSQMLSFRLKFTGEAGSLGYIPPTHFLKDKEMNVTLAGLRVTLVHIPGETDDHMGLWIPDRRVFMCGDTIYKAFPNLYALRGTPPRNSMTWVNSLDIIRNLRPEYLVPSHTQPLQGEDYIYNLLTTYRDAIQLIHDQSVRYINKGLYPEDIVSKIKLPEELADHPYLREVYGTVRWSVKSVFTNYLGWFSGNIAELEPLNTKEKALRMIHLAGGVGSLAAAAQNALHKGDYRWALELASHIFHLNPDHEQAKHVRLEALKALASMQTSGNGRHYYLSTALEDHRLIDIQLPQTLRNEVIQLSSMQDLFRALTVRLKAEEATGQKIVVAFNFTDTNETYMLTLRNCIIDVEDAITWNWDVKVTLETIVWRRLLTKELNPLTAYLSGDITIEGGILLFRRFMGYFEQN